MKKAFVLSFCVAFCSILSAQDIIVTAKAERIEALITEVSSTEIRYKKWDFQDGPTFVLNANELSSIIYKNGEVQVFNNKNEKSAFNDSTLHESLDYIYRSDGEFVFQGRYISAKEYAQILEKNCPIAYKNYKRSKRFTIAGAVFTGIGGGSIIMGIGMLFYAPAVSVSLDVISIISCSIGIPLLVVALKNERKSIDIYNRNCASQLELSLNLNQTGMGIALNF